MKIKITDIENVKVLPDKLKATGISKKKEKAAIAKKISTPSIKGNNKPKFPILEPPKNPKIGQMYIKQTLHYSQTYVWTGKKWEKIVPIDKKIVKIIDEAPSIVSESAIAKCKQRLTEKPKPKKVIAKVTKPVTITAKVVAKVKKAITKEKKHGKKNRGKNR